MLYCGKVKNKYKIKLWAQSKRYDQEQIIFLRPWCLLNIHKTNCISCLITTEQQQMWEGLAERKAARGMSTESPVIAWRSEIGIANLPNRHYIFKNKLQIRVLNNYILAWKTLKTTFHDTIKENIKKILQVFGQWCFTSPQEQTRTHIEKRLLSVWKYKIHCLYFLFVCALWCNKPNTAKWNEWRRSFIPLYHAQVTNLVTQSTFCSELSSTLLVPFVVLDTPMKG